MCCFRFLNLMCYFPPKNLLQFTFEKKLVVQKREKKLLVARKLTPGYQMVHPLIQIILYNYVVLDINDNHVPVFNASVVVLTY